MSLTSGQPSQSSSMALPQISGMGHDGQDHSVHDPQPGTSVCVHPPAPSQASLVQGSLSAQPYAVPTHAPPLHVSPNVQLLPSIQEAVFGVKVHPLAGAQSSSVHTLPSLQLCPVPGLQMPPPQVSPTVHRLPS